MLTWGFFTWQTADKLPYSKTNLNECGIFEYPKKPNIPERSSRETGLNGPPMDGQEEEEDGHAAKIDLCAVSGSGAEWTTYKESHPRCG